MLQMHNRPIVLVLAIFGCLGAACGFAGCGAPPSPWEGVPGGAKHVLVSFPPLYCFTRSVAGPDAKVLCLLTTVGPHDYQPTAADALKVRKADLFLVNGLGLDDFITRLVDSSGNTRVKVVRVAEAIPEKELLAMDEEDEHDHKDKHAHQEAHGHSHGEHDPHVWLGLPQAVVMVNHIRDELIAIDPEHKSGYTRRAADYVQELQKLLEQGRKELEGKKNRRLITTHESLGYFARAFNLQIVGAIQVRAGVEPDAGKLKTLADLAKRDQVHVIAVEPQYMQARTGANALIREIGPQGKQVEVIEIDPLETIPHAADLHEGTYVSKIKANIDALAKALP
jgi:ABC-type Zn uptake system ZnuABC Zn-binding protein ZnuA